MHERVVAFIGLGRMGGPMCDRVISAGHEVRVFDVVSDAIAPRVDAGAVEARSPAEAARYADSVHVVVLDDEQVIEVVCGSEGVLSSDLAPGAVVSIHSTVELATIARLETAAADAGVRLVDAPISAVHGGPAEGRLLVMVGGDSAAVDAARDVYGLFSREVIHVGALGTGVALKLARNTAGYIMMAATHEALALAHAAGIGPDLVRYVIETAGVFTQALLPIDNGGPRPIGADADPALRSHLERTNSIGQKDLHQALATAATLGVDLTVAKAVVAEFDRVTRLREGPGE